MSQFFASPAVQTTTGARGKTTGQKRTKTVRGDEGVWIAQVKEELTAREPEAAFLVTVRSEYTSGIVYVSQLFRCPTRELAAQRLAQWQSHDKYVDPNCTKTFSIVEVLVKWVLKGNGDVEAKIVS